MYCSKKLYTIELIVKMFNAKDAPSSPDFINPVIIKYKDPINIAR